MKGNGEMGHNDSLLHNMVRVQWLLRELHKAGTRGRDGTRISKAKWAARIIIFQPRGDILGTCYLIITKCEKI
jgi:hypothetical protein